MDMRKKLEGKWLTAAGMEEEEATVTIKRVRLEEVGKDESKPVVYFNELEKGLVLNKTNAHTFIELHGEETDDWIGQQVTLFVTTTNFEGKQVEAIRVKGKPRVPRRRPAAPAAIPPPEPVDDDDDSDSPF